MVREKTKMFRINVIPFFLWGKKRKRKKEERKREREKENTIKCSLADGNYNG